MDFFKNMKKTVTKTLTDKPWYVIPMVAEAVFTFFVGVGQLFWPYKTLTMLVSRMPTFAKWFYLNGLVDVTMFVKVVAVLMTLVHYLSLMCLAMLIWEVAVTMFS